MAIYGPTDVWPEHPKKEPREVLAELRADGWTLRIAAGHAWGVVHCPGGHDEQRHELSVFSTAKDGGSGTAVLLRRLLTKCRAARAASTAETISEAAIERILTDVDAIIDAAVGLQVRNLLLRRVEDSLAADTADDEDRLEKAYEMEAEARAAEEAAWAEAARFGHGDPWPPERGVDSLIEAALERLGEALDQGDERIAEARGRIEKIWVTAVNLVEVQDDAT